MGIALATALLDSRLAKLTHPIPGTWIPLTVRESQKRWPKKHESNTKPKDVKAQMLRLASARCGRKTALRGARSGAGAKAMEWVTALLLYPRCPRSMKASKSEASMAEAAIQAALSPKSLAKVDARTNEKII